MYHALALEDLLDLVNITAACPVPGHWCGLVAGWPQVIARMFYWLDGLCHPDGEIAFFNDAALGIAPSAGELKEYAGRLGLVASPFSESFGVQGLTCTSCPACASLALHSRAGYSSKIGEDGSRLAHFPNSGYIRVQTENMVALLDTAPVGPDYLPGHAHADTLSFELSLFGQRVLVNSGTSRYGTGPQRLKERGTACHNTVEIDGQDSTEVWGGFRVARRAKPFGLHIKQDDNRLFLIGCAHDGYKRLPGKMVHRREWRFFENSLEMVDTLEGSFKQAIGRLFFHPIVSVEATGNTGRAELGNERVLHWQVEGALCQLVPAEYHPEFGLSEPNVCLEMHFNGPRCAIRLSWSI
jgi:hypothetical protein